MWMACEEGSKCYEIICLKNDYMLSDDIKFRLCLQRCQTFLTIDLLAILK